MIGPDEQFAAEEAAHLAAEEAQDRIDAARPDLVADKAVEIWTQSATGAKGAHAEMGSMDYELVWFALIHLVAIEYARDDKLFDKHVDSVKALASIGWIVAQQVKAQIEKQAEFMTP